MTIRDNKHRTRDCSLQNCFSPHFNNIGEGQISIVSMIKIISEHCLLSTEMNLKIWEKVINKF